MGSIYRKSKFNKTHYSISDIVNGKAVVIKITVDKKGFGNVVDSRIVEAVNEQQVKYIINSGQYTKHMKYNPNAPKNLTLN